MMEEKIVVPYIEGDGSGEDIWKSSQNALEEAILAASRGARKIEWIPLLAGQKALDKYGVPIPEETLNEVRKRRVAIKGPLTTPVGGGFRSVNVLLRQVFDLYVCMRPIRYFPGLPSPLKRPEAVDLIIFRENTEDVYRGIEWQEGSVEAQKLLAFLKKEMEVSLSADTALGIKPMSRSGTRRFARWVFEYTAKHQRKTVTIVHKGNIMKYTEGAFMKWTYEVAREVSKETPRMREEGNIAVNDRIADNMFMQIILRPEEYDVLLCPNLNGDYLSDACAALIGGLGVAPGANIGDDVAIFEPTHGSAPRYAGKDMINPTSFLLSGAMLYRHMGLQEAAKLLEAAVEQTIRDGIVTYDLARIMDGVKPVACSRFGEEVARRIRT